LGFIASEYPGRIEMNATPQTIDQNALWNGPAAEAWIEGRELLDRLLKPFEDLLVEAVIARGTRQVFDVGCGTGATTLAVARALGSRGDVTGIDLSAPMIEVARSRAAREKSTARFICADVQSHDFAPLSVDSFISRFGVMFFEDPVRAFTHMRAAAAARATLDLITWRSAAENPFMTTAERAAAPLLPDLPPRRADGPGQFAFADAELVRGILIASGWRDVDLEPLDIPCVMPVQHLDDYVTRLGPVGLALQRVDAATRAAVTGAVRAAFQPYVIGDEVRFTAACWMIRADAMAARHG
jgi:SAM-dependent methyltransferase